jgi:hypothetical protein
MGTPPAAASSGSLLALASGSTDSVSSGDEYLPGLWEPTAFEGRVLEVVVDVAPPVGLGLDAVPGRYRELQVSVEQTIDGGPLICKSALVLYYEGAQEELGVEVTGDIGKGDRVEVRGVWFAFLDTRISADNDECVSWIYLMDEGSYIRKVGENACQVSVEVYDRSSGRALPGATVWASASPGIHVTADAQGKALLRVSCGQGEIRASVPGYVEGAWRGTLGSSSRIRIPMERTAGGRATVNVRDAVTGEAIAGATVWLESDASVRTSTNSQGVATLVVPNGSQAISASKSGYSGGRWQGTDPGTSSITISLSPAWMALDPCRSLGKVLQSLVAFCEDAADFSGRPEAWAGLFGDLLDVERERALASSLLRYMPRVVASDVTEDDFRRAAAFMREMTTAQEVTLSPSTGGAMLLLDTKPQCSISGFTIPATITFKREGTGFAISWRDGQSNMRYPIELVGRLGSAASYVGLRCSIDLEPVRGAVTIFAAGGIGYHVELSIALSESARAVITANDPSTLAFDTSVAGSLNLEAGAAYGVGMSVSVGAGAAVPLEAVGVEALVDLLGCAMRPSSAARSPVLNALESNLRLLGCAVEQLRKTPDAELFVEFGVDGYVGPYAKVDTPIPGGEAGLGVAGEGIVRCSFAMSPAALGVLLVHEDVRRDVLDFLVKVVRLLDLASEMGLAMGGNVFAALAAITNLPSAAPILCELNGCFFQQGLANKLLAYPEDVRRAFDEIHLRALIGAGLTAEAEVAGIGLELGGSLVLESGLDLTTLLALFALRGDEIGGIEVCVKSMGEVTAGQYVNAQVEKEILSIKLERTESTRSVASTKPAGDKSLVVTATCPVDLVVTSPDGASVSKTRSTIPGATYLEMDLNGDGDPDDQVAIPKAGSENYHVAVVPESGSSPGARYSLVASNAGSLRVLADEVRVSDMPSSPYVVRGQLHRPSGVLLWGMILLVGLLVTALGTLTVYSYAAEYQSPLQTISDMWYDRRWLIVAGGILIVLSVGWTLAYLVTR